MKRIPACRIMISCIALLLGAVSQADACHNCYSSEEILCEECIPVTHRESLWDFGGWIEGGIMANQYGQKDAYDANGLIPDSGNTSHLKNVKHASFQMNQLWFCLATAQREEQNLAGRALGPLRHQPGTVLQTQRILDARRGCRMAQALRSWQRLRRLLATAGSELETLHVAARPSGNPLRHLRRHRAV